jgi:hypothetical protein
MHGKKNGAEKLVCFKDDITGKTATTSKVSFGFHPMKVDFL